MTRKIFVIVAVLALSACAPTPTEPAESASPSSVPSVAPEASVERWAGLVAERQLETVDWLAGWEDSNCSAFASAAPDCNLQLMTARFLAQTNDIVIAGPSDPQALTYLGPVPEEIADLYGETIALTAAARSAGDAWSSGDCGIGTETDACFTLALNFERAMDDVRTKFAAWDPYL